MQAGMDLVTWGLESVVAKTVADEETIRLAIAWSYKMRTATTY